MIIFETTDGEKIKIYSDQDQELFEAARVSTNPNAFFYVGEKCYFIRHVKNCTARQNRGRPLASKNLY
jgi:hypothetical protein